LDGGADLGESPVTIQANGTGVATLSPSFSTAGTHAITARYLGDAAFAPSTSTPPVGIEVTAPGAPAGTSTTLRVSDTDVAVGQPVTFEATVTSGQGTPVGTVRFLDGGSLLGAVAVSPAQGTVTLTVLLSPGAHTITAVYLGGGNFQPSTSA